MTVTTTAAGVTHLAERDAEDPLTNAFDALELGKGNDDATALDARDDVDNADKLAPPGLVQVLAGYPVLGDEDVRNPGRAADRWTWAFRLSGVQHGPLVASTGWITNYASGAPLAAEPVGFAWDDILQLRSDEVVTVFVNAKTGSAATVYYVAEEVTSETATAATYAQRFPLAATYPRGVRSGPTRIRFEAVEGAPVYLMALALGEFGHPVTREEVEFIRPRVYVENERTGRWDELGLDASYAVEESVSDTPIVTDLRWPYTRGYNIGLWVDLERVAPGRRAVIELEIRTSRGLLEPPAFEVQILPRVGRYSLT